MAKRDYLSKSDAYFAHPYYWASFIHLGNDMEFEETPKGNVLLLLMAVPVLILALYFGNKKRKRII